MLSLPQNMFDLGLHHHNTAPRWYTYNQGSGKETWSIQFFKYSHRQSHFNLHLQQRSASWEAQEVYVSALEAHGGQLGKDALNSCTPHLKASRPGKRLMTKIIKETVLSFSRTKDRLQETEPTEIRHHHPLLPPLIPGTKYKLIEPQGKKIYIFVFIRIVQLLFPNPSLQNT